MEDGQDDGLDGINQMKVINGDMENSRKEMVYNIKIFPMSGAVR